MSILPKQIDVNLIKGLENSDDADDKLDDDVSEVSDCGAIIGVGVLIVATISTKYC